MNLSLDERVTLIVFLEDFMSAVIAVVFCLFELNTERRLVLELQLHLLLLVLLESQESDSSQ